MTQKRNSTKDPDMVSLQKENEAMKGALQVLHTWASYDVEAGRLKALVPEHVVDLCNKALGRTK